MRVLDEAVDERVSDDSEPASQLERDGEGEWEERPREGCAG